MRYIAASDTNGHFVLDTRHKAECFKTRYATEASAAIEADRMNRLYAGVIEAAAAIKARAALFN